MSQKFCTRGREPPGLPRSKIRHKDCERDSKTLEKTQDLGNQANGWVEIWVGETNGIICKIPREDVNRVSLRNRIRGNKR